MKQTILLFSLVILLSLGAMAQCCKPKNSGSSSEKKDVTGQTVKFKITGMTCAGCSKHIHDALTQQEGILDNQVEYPGDLATITYNPEKITVEKIIAAIKVAGYKAELIRGKKVIKS